MITDRTLVLLHSEEPFFFTDRILAALAVLEIDQIEGFFSPSKRASYTGLVPSTYASGGRIFHRVLIPMSNKW